jgi:hypothetical protein
VFIVRVIEERDEVGLRCSHAAVDRDRGRGTPPLGLPHANLAEVVVTPIVSQVLITLVVMLAGAVILMTL